VFDRLEKRAESGKKSVQFSYKYAIQRKMKRSGSVFDLPPLSYGQAPIQRIKEEELPLVQNRLAVQFGSKVFGKEAVKDILLNYFVSVNSPTTRGKFEEWLSNLSQNEAVEYATVQLTKEQGEKSVYTCGDQELGTAMDAMSSGYIPIATYLHLNASEELEQRKKQIQESRGTVFGSVMLTDGGHMQYADKLGSGKFVPRPKAFLKLPESGIDRTRSILAFDHPYTSGYNTNPTTRAEVKSLTTNFYQFGKQAGMGRFHLLVRAQDHGGKNTRGVYNLVPQGLYLYAVQRTKVRRHATTMGSYKGASIIPEEQSLIYKFADFKVLFHTLYELAVEFYNKYDEGLKIPFMIRLEKDLNNRRFPQGLRKILSDELDKYNKCPRLNQKNGILLGMLRAIIYFDYKNEQTGERISLLAALPAGEQEFSDDDLD